ICDQLTAVKDEESTLEGNTLTLSYRLSREARSDDYFYWYRQYPGKPPEFLISHSGTGVEISDPVPGVTFKVSDNKTLMTLQISSAAVTDSAVYYMGPVEAQTQQKPLEQRQPNTPQHPLEGATHC
uniref:Immunoglobulin V-set domain-containing protein n=1 Tax=Oreochromis aureus TaxID=47969 RepID=A0AAZ1X6F4_OREAU